MLRRWLIALALLLAPLGAATALAHQQKIAITTVSANPRTGMIEIVHQVPLHDAEHALIAQGIKKPDILGSDTSREQLATYVARRFLLEVDGKVAQPTYVGSEIDGGSLWVYLELPGARGAQLKFNSQILTDVWAQQENRVNIGGGTHPQTFIFKAGDPPREAVLTR